MSDYIKPCLYKGKALNNQWMNSILNSHDLFCGCTEPIDHLKAILPKKEWPRTKDVGIGTKDGDGDDDDFHIDEGDLKQLFEEEKRHSG